MEKLKRFLGFQLPTFGLTLEREEEIIDKIVKTIKNNNMVLPASFFLYGFEPMSTIFSHMLVMPTSDIEGNAKRARRLRDTCNTR